MLGSSDMKSSKFTKYTRNVKKDNLVSVYSDVNSSWSAVYCQSHYYKTYLLTLRVLSEEEYLMELDFQVPRNKYKENNVLLE